MSTTLENSTTAGPLADNGTEMEPSRSNRLKDAASAYLRSAMNQPVEWMEWGPAAFERAAQEDKPILLDIGAVWCHWCHVMDRESYENPATARIINEHFVAVKVDRDERPDVDARYQAAISAISGQGGWPLTAFLTPDGKPYFGGTYFPPQDRHGRPGLQRVLLTMADAFANRRAEVSESAGSVMDAIEQNESFSGHAGNPGAELVEKMVLSVLKIADLRHGGFGGQPKFPHTSALDLLIDAASRPSRTTVKLGTAESLSLPDAARRVATLTLHKMARGGVYDQLAGGFHRYSVDEHWTVPHFEKMAYDNSLVLRNYVHAYQAFGDEEFARVARDIIRWMDEWLTDRERSGFYASQDADLSMDDDGDYFTWTRDEAAEILTPSELDVAAAFYDIGEIGEMQHNPARNVLHVKHNLEVIARKLGMPVEQAGELLEAARTKLYAARLQRPVPYVDKTIYVSWNALCVSAYLEASRVLGLPEARSFALKSLDRILDQALDANGALSHVVAYGESGTPAKAVPGLLDDYIFLAHAALDAWESTTEMRYYDAAARLVGSGLTRFYDEANGGFFDTEQSPGGMPLGALVARRKPLQDGPTPAGNPAAASLLMRMAELNGSLAYAEKAQATLEAFAGVVEHFGLYACSYATALQRLVREPVQVCVLGEDALALDLEHAALRPFAVNVSVLRFPSTSFSRLPPVLETTVPRLPVGDGSLAVVCSGHACQPPVRTPEALTDLLDQHL